VSTEINTSQPRSRRAHSLKLKLEPGQSLPTQQVLRLAARFHPGQRYFLYIPASGGREAPVFVTVHGLSRNANKHARSFASYCEAHNLVLVAPVFSRRHSAGYQRLGGPAGRGTRADSVLESILEEVSHLTGARGGPIYLFGFSAGAQFAHRFAMAFPHRVARLVVACAGWYTFPDAGKRFPYGIRAGRKLEGVRFDPEAFLQVPITVMVGEQDTTTAGHLRSTERVNRQQGQSRLERSRNWVDAMQAAAQAYHLEPLVRLHLIPGGDHSFTKLLESGGLAERVFAAFFNDHAATPLNGPAAKTAAGKHG
jgi:poly(3-hydroxybutyrate) depolymerase